MCWADSVELPTHSPQAAPADPGMTDTAHPVATSSVVTTKRIAKGAVIRPEDVTVHDRIGAASSIQYTFEVVGQRATKGMESGYQITPADLQSVLSDSPPVKPAKQQSNKVGAKN